MSFQRSDLGIDVDLEWAAVDLGIPTRFNVHTSDGDPRLFDLLHKGEDAAFVQEAVKVGLDFEVRPQFLPIFTRDNWRWGTIVAHRRAGKTVAAVQKLVKHASMAPKTFPPHRYSLVSPTYQQAKDTAWQYLKAYTSRIPGIDIRVSELSVTFPHNHARIRLFGSDNYDSLRGGYNHGLVMDETGDHDPRAWAEVLRPTLSDHHGWGLFLGTPRGDNMFKEMADAARANVEGNWFFLELKASETGLIAPEELRDASRQMSRAQYLAEYECSFDAGALGAYYAEDIATLMREGRVTNIPHERLADVYCSWDLGIGDTTALWTFQLVGNEIRFLDCMEDSGKDLGHYVDWVKALPYRVHEHVLPHDAEARELQTGNSRLAFLQMRGLNCRVLPKHRIEDGIEAVRVKLPRMWFAKGRTDDGLKALRNYRADYDSKRKRFLTTPRHDWASQLRRQHALRLRVY